MRSGPGVTLLGYAKIVRPLSMLAAAAEVPIGVSLAGGTVSDLDVFLTTVAIALAMAVANITNDVVDRANDRIGNPGRPIPSGRISVAGATWCAFGLSAAAIALVAHRSEIARILLAILALSMAYSAVFKCTIVFGNLVVAFLCAVPLVLGSAIAGDVSVRAWFGFLMLLVFVLAYEVLKDVRDRDADRAVGCRTLATRYGARRAVIAFRLIVICLAALSVVPVIVNWAVNWVYVFCIGVGTVGPTVLVSWLLPTTAPRDRVAAALRTMVVGWVPGLIAIGALR